MSKPSVPILKKRKHSRFWQINAKKQFGLKGYNPKHIQSSHSKVQYQNLFFFSFFFLNVPIKYTRNTKLNGMTPVVSSYITNILIDVLLSGGWNGDYDYDCEPNLPQLSRATYNVCDVIKHTLGASIPSEEILA